MPLATLLALAAGAAALRLRSRVLAPVGEDPAWRAALYGSLAAGIVGSLVEDSGPLLLVTAVFTGGCVLCYLWGRPRPVRPPVEKPVRTPLRRAPARAPVGSVLLRAPSADEQDHGHDHQHTIRTPPTM